MRSAASFMLVVSLLGCSQKGAPATKGGPAPEPKQAAQSSDAGTKAAQNPKDPTPAGVPEYKNDIPGQLDRLDEYVRHCDFTFNGRSSKKYFDTFLKDLPVLREAAAISDETMDPRCILYLAQVADLVSDSQGTITYGMLTKNADRYASVPWFIESARIIDIQESKGGITLARVEMDPGTHPLFVVGRFLTNFVEGDRVDIVGFFAGDHTYQSQGGREITIPAFAAGAMLKKGSFVALNRSLVLWRGNPAPEVDRLRMKPRKL